MIRYLKNNPDTLLAILLGFWAILSTLLASSLELTSVETYYYEISKSLDFGYNNDQPLTAWMVRFGSAFGACRLFAVLLQPIALFLFWKVLKTSKSDYGSALRFFAVSFSIPLLHYYGFVASPVAPILFGVAVTFWGVKCINASPINYLSIIYLALGLAVVGYTDLWALVIVVAIIAANYKILLDWRFIVSMVVALLALYPVILHAATFSQESLKTVSFMPSDILGYFLCFFVLLNPFFTIPLIGILIDRNPFRKNYRPRFFIFYALVVLVFAVRYPFSNVAMMPMIFPLVYFIYRASKRYVIVVTSIFSAVLLGLSIYSVCTPWQFTRFLGLSGKEFGLHNAVAALNEETAVQLLVVEDNSQLSAMFNFHTKIPSCSIADVDGSYYGKRVAVEVKGSELEKVPTDERYNIFKSMTIPTMGTVFYTIEESYVPTSMVEIELKRFPDKVLTGQKLAIALVLKNPYVYDIPLEGDNGFRLILEIASADNVMHSVPLLIKPNTLRSDGELSLSTSAVIPELPTGNYYVGVTLFNYPNCTALNSKVHKVLIVNP